MSSCVLIKTSFVWTHCHLNVNFPLVWCIDKKMQCKTYKGGAQRTIGVACVESANMG